MLPTPLSRRQVLAGAVAAAVAGCTGVDDQPQSTTRRRERRDNDRPQSTTRRREHYGPGRRQYGEWTIPPSEDRLPVAMLIHGGAWHPDYGPDLERPTAAAVADIGLAVWNVDYRASDVDYPATFRDAAAALDHLRRSRFTDRLDLDRVAVVGHSAGGHLALWLASRPNLPASAPGAPDGKSVIPTLAIARAPVPDLVTAHRLGLGGDAVEMLMDATPGEAAQRYTVSSPQALLPVRGTKLLLVHGTADDVVPLAQSEHYAAAARRSGTDVRLDVVEGADHAAHLDPDSSAARPVLARLSALTHGHTEE